MKYPTTLQIEKLADAMLAIAIGLALATFLFLELSK